MAILTRHFGRARIARMNDNGLIPDNISPSLLDPADPGDRPVHTGAHESSTSTESLPGGRKHCCSTYTSPKGQIVLPNGRSKRGLLLSI